MQILYHIYYTCDLSACHVCLPCDHGDLQLLAILSHIFCKCSDSVVHEKTSHVGFGQRLMKTSAHSRNNELDEDCQLFLSKIPQHLSMKI